MADRWKNAREAGLFLSFRTNDFLQFSSFSYALIFLQSKGQQGDAELGRGQDAERQG